MVFLAKCSICKISGSALSTQLEPQKEPYRMFRLSVTSATCLWYAIVCTAFASVSIQVANYESNLFEMVRRRKKQLVTLCLLFLT